MHYIYTRLTFILPYQKTLPNCVKTLICNKRNLFNKNHKNFYCMASCWLQNQTKKKIKKSIVSSMKHLKQVFRCLLSYTLIIPSICVCCFIRLVPKFLHRYALVSLTFPVTSSICLYIIK